MIPAHLRALAGSALVTVAACASTPPQNGDLYHNFILLDPATERGTPHAWMLIADGPIVRVGAGLLTPTRCVQATANWRAGMA